MHPIFDDHFKERAGQERKEKLHNNSYFVNKYQFVKYGKCFSLYYELNDLIKQLKYICHFLELLI